LQVLLTVLFYPGMCSWRRVADISNFRNRIPNQTLLSEYPDVRVCPKSAFFLFPKAKSMVTFFILLLLTIVVIIFNNNSF